MERKLNCLSDEDVAQITGISSEIMAAIKNRGLGDYLDGLFRIEASIGSQELLNSENIDALLEEVPNVNFGSDILAATAREIYEMRKRLSEKKVN